MTGDRFELGRRGFLRLAKGGTALAASAWLSGCDDGSTIDPVELKASAPARLPSADEMMGWVKEIVGQGVRRPGYAADAWVEQWALGRFEELGLNDVRLEPVSAPYWEAQVAELRVDGEAFLGFALPHTARGVVEAELAIDGAGGLEGRIAVREIEFMKYPQSLFRTLATRAYDPTNEFDALEHILPFNAEQNEVMNSTVEAKAAGFVGLLTGVPWETSSYYVPYDAKERPIPGVWLSKADGQRLLARMARGPTLGRLEVRAERREVTSHNVIGTLPGRSDEWIVVASHHDGPWASAVEDGSGTAMVLAQAAYWAAVPEAERPHNLLFLLGAAHMAGAAGTRAFIDAHPDLLDKIVLEVHLEHAARRAEPDGAGGLVATDEPEVRWWFTSKNPALEAAVYGAVSANDLRRSLIFAPTALSAMPPTDGAYFYPEGVPIVHFLTAPMYLFDACDTIDKVHEASFEPIGRAVVQIIEATRGVTAAAMRAGVAP